MLSPLRALPPLATLLQADSWRQVVADVAFHISPLAASSRHSSRSSLGVESFRRSSRAPLRELHSQGSRRVEPRTTRSIPPSCRLMTIALPSAATSYSLPILALHVARAHYAPD